MTDQGHDDVLQGQALQEDVSKGQGLRAAWISIVERHLQHDEAVQGEASRAKGDCRGLKEPV